MPQIDTLRPKKQTFPPRLLPPHPPKKRTGCLKGGIFILLAVLLIGGSAGWLGHQIKIPKTLAEPVDFTVQKGDSVDVISRNLEKSGLIDYPFVFKIYLVLSNQSSNLKAGSFHFADSVDIPQIVRIISAGEIAKNQVTIVEGMRREEIAKFLESRGLIKAKDFILATDSPADKSKYPFLASLDSSDSLEGFLFPDTYQLGEKPTAQLLVEKMLTNFEDKYNLEFANLLKNQDLSLPEVVNLASIIEREVSKPSERATVAGIYFNRLNIEMKLQADPTIQYAKDTQTPPAKYLDYWAEITMADYRQVISKYNTYLHLGLPPGPICNPSLSSIEAVLKPKKSDYY